MGLRRRRGCGPGHRPVGFAARLHARRSPLKEPWYWQTMRPSSGCSDSPIVNQRLLPWLPDGKREIEGRPRPGARLNPHPATLPFDCLPAECQAKSVGGKLSPVESLKGLKNTFLKGDVYPWAIVLNSDHPLRIPAFRRDVDVRIGSAAVFDSVPNQVVQHLGQEVEVPAHAR